MYKLVKPDGADFYSGTIDYVDNIGKIIRVTDCDSPGAGTNAGVAWEGTC